MCEQEKCCFIFQAAEISCGMAVQGYEGSLGEKNYVVLFEKKKKKVGK